MAHHAPGVPDVGPAIHLEDVQRVAVGDTLITVSATCGVVIRAKLSSETSRPPPPG